MTSDLDALDAILFEPPTKIARAVGRFQPKISRLHKKEKPIKSSAILPEATEKTIVRPCSSTTTDPSSKHLVNHDLVLNGDGDSKKDIERLKTEFQVAVEPTKKPSSELVSQQSTHLTNDPHFETAISDTGGDLPAETRPDKEAEVMTSNLDALDDILFQPATKTVPAVGRFQPKISSLRKNAKTIRPSTTLAGPYTQTIVKPNSTTPKGQFAEVLVTQGLVADGDRDSENDLERLRAAVTVGSIAPMDPSSEPLVIQDSTHPTGDPHSEVRVSENNVDLYTDPEILGREAADVFSSLESLDDFLLQPITASGRTVDKFPPQSTGQPTSEKSVASFSIVADASNCFSPPSDSLLHASNTRCLVEDPTLLAFPIDSLTANSCISTPLNPSSEDGNVDLQKDLRRSEKEVAVSSALESIDDALFEPPTSTVRAVGKFRPKLISQRKDKKDLSLPSMLSDAPESIYPRNEGFEGGPNHSVTPTSDSVECSTIDPCNPIENPHSEAGISNGYGDLLMDHGRLGREATEAFSGLESFGDLLFQPATTDVRGVRKFQPKYNAHSKKVAPSSPSIPHESIDTHPSPRDAHFHHSELENLEASTSFSHDSFVGFSTISPFDSAPIDRPSELMTQEVVPEDLQQSANIRKRKGSSETKEIAGNRGHVLATGEENETGKSSRKLRKRVTVRDPVDEIDDGPADSEDLPETSNFSVMDEENDHDDEYRGEDMPKQKRAPRKSKKVVSEDEKPARRRKKASEACDPSNKKPPRKKFSHSTRRNRTLVDKDLLTKPEEEIDPRKLIMKDLILLAETKERKMIKEAAAFKKAFPNQSSNNSFSNDTPFEEDDAFASTRGLNSDDDQENTEVKPNCSKLNYHSFMNRATSERWSKSDTELFYEAIRQFGTDFAMVQQLFPGRTRHQVKLKYKKEERKHPLQLADALTRRSEDHFHFELVIERLQQAQVEQNSNVDAAESLDATVEKDEERGYSDRDDGEVEKAEQNENSPVKSHESQDEFEWSQYGSANASTQDTENGDYYYF